MPRFLVLAVACSLATLGACHHVETSYRYAEGVATVDPRPADAPVEVMEGRPSRPFRSLGTVEVRVDRGTALKNPTLADAMPALTAQARGMGADAIILTHEQFASWYDRGEDAAPIHDLERQETWYITEKARYVTGVAIAYTGCAPPPCAPPSLPSPVAPSPVPMPPATAPMPPPAPPPPPVSAPPPAPPPPAPPAPAEPPTIPVAPTAPSLPEGPIELPPAPDAPKAPEMPPPPPAPEAPKAPEVPPVPETPKAPEVPPAPGIPK